VGYQVKRGDTLSAIARRFGLSRDDIVRWNNITNPNHILAGSMLKLRPPVNEDAPMSDETPKPENSQHAADHIEGVLDEMDNVFNEVKASAAGVRAKLRAEGKQMRDNLQTFEQRVVGRMASANTRFQRMLGGNGGPPLDDDVLTLEHKPEE